MLARLWFSLGSPGASLGGRTWQSPWWRHKHRTKGGEPIRGTPVPLTFDIRLFQETKDFTRQPNGWKVSQELTSSSPQAPITFRCIYFAYNWVYKPDQIRLHDLYLFKTIYWYTS